MTDHRVVVLDSPPVGAPSPVRVHRKGLTAVVAIAEVLAGVGAAKPKQERWLASGTAEDVRFADMCERVVEQGQRLIAWIAVTPGRGTPLLSPWSTWPAPPLWIQALTELDLAAICVAALALNADGITAVARDSAAEEGTHGIR